jgi:tRNA (mo5U34)-methyltransferase
MTPEAIRRRISELGNWFQNFELGGVPTAPHHFLGDYPRCKWRKFAHAIPPDLRGKTVLDIGCNAGFYSMEMKQRGADRVVGIDHDPVYLEQARFASEVRGLDIEFRQLDIYSVADLGERFDIVLFMGVLYHLRHPLLALDLLREHVVKDRLIFQSLVRGWPDIAPLAPNYPFSETEVFLRPGFPAMYFVERSYSNDPTNWWIPNRACVEAMLRSSGFEVLDNPEGEVFLCGCAPVPRIAGPSAPSRR